MIFSILLRMLHTTYYLLLALLIPLQVHAQGIYEDTTPDGGVVGLEWILILIQNVLNIALRLVGIAALVMFVVGSIKMISSSGDPKGVESAKSIFTMAIGGLVVAALAWFAFSMLSEITGVTSILDPTFPIE